MQNLTLFFKKKTSTLFSTLPDRTNIDNSGREICTICFFVLVAHPCKNNNGNCEHICIPSWKKNIASAHCICKPGYQLKGRGKCVGKS